MNLLKIVFISILVFFAALPLSADEFKLKNFLPEKMEELGFKAEEEPFVAIDEATLSMIINGAAPRFFELGTKKACFANYEKNQVYLMLEIYETDSIKSSEKLFEEFKTDSSKPLKNLGTKSRFTSEMGGSYLTEYIQDRFYVKLSITKKSEANKEIILKCARTISDNISKQTK